MQGDKSGARVRAEAAKAVHAVVHEGRSLDDALARAEVSGSERPLLRLLSYEVLRWHWRLRWQLSQLLERPLKSRDGVIEALLAVGLYQLSDTRIPDHAAVSTTVEAARLLRRPKFSGLINAVLRNFGRRNIAGQEPGDEEARFNHPAWLLERLRDDWPQHWPQILAANNERAPMWLRVNCRRTTAADYLAELRQAGIEGGELLPGVDGALRLEKALEVEKLPGFRDGLVSVQDGAAQIAAAWLLEGGGARILDACAAPGGKTGHLLELLAAGGALTAIDQDRDRLAKVSETLERLGGFSLMVLRQ